jgi:hypothetical protein
MPYRPNQFQLTVIKPYYKDNSFKPLQNIPEDVTALAELRTGKLPQIAAYCGHVTRRSYIASSGAPLPLLSFL